MSTCLTCALSTQYNIAVTIPEQLLQAMKNRGWTVGQLHKQSRIKCDRSSLQRKLHGQQGLKTEEIQKLVNALGVAVMETKPGVVYSIEPRRRAS